MACVAGRIVFVEDSLARATEIRRLLDLYRSGAAMRDGRRVPRLSISNEEYWDPGSALERIGGAAPFADRPDADAEIWDADDQLFMDCWDRDAMEESVSRYRSTFFAVDLLRALRVQQEAGRTIPRVVVHSRGMQDDLLRAALSEFTRTRHRVRVPDATPVVRWRLADAADEAGAVVWAMFDRTDLERNLDRIIAGDRDAAMQPPDASSAVWAQVHPTSCLASFHCAVRDECPEVWDAFVIGRGRDEVVPGGGRRGLGTAAIARVTRIAHRYLDFNESWGVRGYRGYLALARALANPER